MTTSTEKPFNGKAIYQPKGKAREYAPWACNFFNGCSNDCDYCYCKRGVLSHVWKNEPTLKKCFRDEDHAIDIFIKELERNIDQLKKTGLFFSFTTDPMLPATLDFHMNAVCLAVERDVPVQILTKRADFLDYWIFSPTGIVSPEVKKKIAVGFTLTGHDELEANASCNMERIKAMRYLNKQGFRTFASIEPVIDGAAAYSMINLISGWCDLIKVGLLSGKRKYKPGEIRFLWEAIKSDTRGSKFYIKDSIISYLGLDREDMPVHCVPMDYNIFTD